MSAFERLPFPLTDGDDRITFLLDTLQPQLCALIHDTHAAVIQAAIDFHDLRVAFGTTMPNELCLHVDINTEQHKQDDYSCSPVLWLSVWLCILPDSQRIVLDSKQVSASPSPWSMQVDLDYCTDADIVCKSNLDQRIQARRSSHHSDRLHAEWPVWYPPPQNQNRSVPD